MGHSDNITPIQQPSVKQKVLFTKLFNNCEKLTLKHIKLILQKMFDNADDTLFALAEKTHSNTESTDYFDSMRIIRLKRSEIEEQHFSQIKQAFAIIKDENGNKINSSEKTTNSLDAFSFDDLSLIEDADLEENIAIKNIVSKVSHHSAQDLSAIEKRLSHILNTDVSATNNPLGPNVISNTFMKAAAALDIELKVSLIILKLFEQAIISGISPLLHEANSLFVNANVLPEFKHTVQKSEHVDNPYDKQENQQDNSPPNQNGTGYPQTNSGQASPMQPNAMYESPVNSNQANSNQATSDQMAYAAGTGTAIGQDTSIGHFSQLLTQHQTQAGAINGEAVANNVHPFNLEHINQAQAGGVEANAAMQSSTDGSPSAQTSGYVVTTPQFIGSLTQLQNIPLSSPQQQSTISTDENGEQVESIQLQSSVNLKDFVIQQLQQQDENFSVNHINPVDQDVIDVVSMLFEFILEDKNIPSEAKAHIARLQIPLLKAAIIDKDFFSTSKNAARSLLNELAHAALGIIDETDPSSLSLLSEIERVVNTINDEFEDDLSLFDQQLTEFNIFLKQHAQQEDNIKHRLEKKTKQKEDHALAYHWVEDTIDEILADKHLPDVIIELINGPWKRVMLNTYLNNGQNSDTWKNQVRFIDVLEWSVQPKHESIDRQKLANIIGQLVMTLRNGLQVIQVSNDDIQKILLQLEPFHVASVKGISVKDYLATLAPHEAFLFDNSNEDVTLNTESDNASQETDIAKISETASAQNQAPTAEENASSNEISKFESNSIVVEDIDFETDENYETNLSLDEIDQTILSMEQELRSLEELAKSIEQDDALDNSGDNTAENSNVITENDSAQPDSYAQMDDDFKLLGDNENMSDDDNFNKLITEDIILSGYSTDQNEAPEDQPQDEYLELARHLEQGKWVEFLDDNQKTTRAKLAWKSDLLGEYTFLNWKFDVVADKTLYGLAADLRRGSANIIDELPLVDRALSAVMSSLTPTGTSSQNS